MWASLYILHIHHLWRSFPHLHRNKKCKKETQLPLLYRIMWKMLIIVLRAERLNGGPIQWNEPADSRDLHSFACRKLDACLNMWFWFRTISLPAIWGKRAIWTITQTICLWCNLMLRITFICFSRHLHGTRELCLRLSHYPVGISKNPVLNPRLYRKGIPEHSFNCPRVWLAFAVRSQLMTETGLLYYKI